METLEMANELNRFAADIGQFREASEAISRELTQVYDGISRLNAFWSGRAHNEFVKQFNIDYEEMQEIVKFLNKMMGDLEFADTEYTKCENAVADLVSNMRLV